MFTHFRFFTSNWSGNSRLYFLRGRQVLTCLLSENMVISLDMIIRNLPAFKETLLWPLKTFRLFSIHWCALDLEIPRIPFCMQRWYLCSWSDISWYWINASGYRKWSIQKSNKNGTWFSKVDFRWFMGFVQRVESTMLGHIWNLQAGLILRLGVMLILA